MDGGQALVLVLKVWLVFIPVIITFGNSKLATASYEPAGRKAYTNSPGFISIDCGASEDYRDDQTGIFYESDTKYIDTGTVNEIPPDSTLEIFQQQVRKLRSFPQGTRNCYTLKPEGGKNNNYLIRAIFYYGNYDQKNQTPVFDLYLGVNKWMTLTDGKYLAESIHAPITDYIDVCLVNTDQGVPYISALELRPLDNTAYKIKAGALSKIARYDAGGRNSIIRYPEDVYDRIWTALNFDEWSPISTESTIYTQSSDDAYKLPAEVFRTAVLSQNANISLSLYFSPPNSASQCYVYFHFAEIQKLKDGQQRKLRIELNSERNLTESIGLEYLQPLTIAQNDPPIHGSRLHFSLFPAEGSDLPPILNAVEVFVSVELQNSPTDLNDVNAIMKIKQMYGVTRNWNGDPCLPRDFLWDGLNCSNQSTPRIVSLNLSSSNLKGGIASWLSNLYAIESLDLSNNNLSGPLPEFLGLLPNLKILNLSGNKLKGSVPDALMEKSNDGSLLLRVGENPDLYLSTPPHEKKKKSVIPVVASAIAVLVILFLLSALAIYKKGKRQGEMVIGSKKEGSLRSKNRPFTYSEIVSITDNFRTIIGEGGFGKVYFGTLKDDTRVAVKMLSASSKQGYKEFRAEAQLLMIVHHRNLVSLIGYCENRENMALVYEYMASGNLREHLSETNTIILSWNERLQIAVDVAQGLEYLHNGCRPPIIHRDLKTSNILLNEHMQAKITDFGLSRVFRNESDSQISTCPAGTPGYLGPEFLSSGNFNKKSDVYSFGVILFELITGRPAMMRGRGNNIHILTWVSPKIERGDIQSIVDPRLQGEFNITSVWKVAEIAMSCLLPTAIQRPEMSHVLAELKECLASDMASGRTWRTQGNRTRSSNSLERASLETDSETAPTARQFP